MTKHKRVLIVEDDEFFRPPLEQCVRAAGYQVQSAGGGEEAKALLSLEAFDVVVSDINMPGVNGVQLFNWIQSHRPVPVVLMTGFSDLAETLDAHHCGAVSFLSKPFQKEELLEALASCFPGVSAEPDPPVDLDSVYCKLSLDDFVSGSDIRYDIYVRLSASKYLRIAHSGQDITVDRIKSYKEKGILHLYMTKEDFKRYVNFNARLAKAVTQSTRIEKPKKLNFLKHTAEVLTACVFGDLPDRETVEDARATMESTMQVLSDYDDAMQVLEMLNTHADFVYAHSVAVSFYSVLIARKLRWKSSGTIFKLSVGGLFHDVGKKEIPADLLAKPRSSLSASEAMLLESHPMRGAQILSELPGLPSDVVQVALEHHENCVGFGFPRRLRRDKIHPLAKVVSAADAFCKLILKTPTGQSGVPPLDAIKQMMTFNAEYFDADASVALMELFRYPVPDGFVDDMKRRQRTA